MPSPRLVHGHRVVKASPATDHLLWARLHRVADGHAPAFARAFRASVRAMRARVPGADYLGAARGDHGSEGRIVQAVSLVPVLKAADPASMNEMSAYYQSVLYNAAKEAFADLQNDLPNLAQPAFTLTMSNPLVIRYAETLGSALIRDVGQNTIDAVRYIVGQAARIGGHPDDVAKLIRQVVGLDPKRAQALVNFYTGSVLPQLDAGAIRQSRADELVSGYADRLLDSRAEAIARTETIRAANMGVRMGGDALLDLPMFTAADLTYVWIVTPDDLLCPYCEAMDGQETAGENGNFQSDDFGDVESPPLHPNCLPGDVLVAPGKGPVVAATMRWYEGPLVELTTSSGQLLSATPNHPVLTDQGWVAAGLVCEGDHVIRGLRTQPTCAVAGPDQYEGVPIQDAVEALRATCPGTSSPVTAEDFHGDGQNGEVYIVDVNGVLGDRFHLAHPQVREQCQLVGTIGSSPLEGHGVGDLLLVGSGASPRGGVGAGHLSPPLNAVHPGPLDKLLLGGSAQDAASAQDGGNGPPPHAPLLGEREHGVSRQVALDEVILVGQRDFSGHVYNLETVDGYYYAGTIVTHNCRCAIARRVADVDALQERMDAQDEAAAALSPDPSDGGEADGGEG